MKSTTKEEPMTDLNITPLHIARQIRYARGKRPVNIAAQVARTRRRYGGATIVLNGRTR